LRISAAFAKHTGTGFSRERSKRTVPDDLSDTNSRAG
jgi:hypothetical protein